ncbi:hypothetical protein DFH06DRAFT_1164597 [Mycena polygramma]|nr:hypothetical protein DFH06DRAFT_1164597 [Mycena polygramma]
MSTFYFLVASSKVPCGDGERARIALLSYLDLLPMATFLSIVSVAANVATVGSFLLGDVPELVDKIQKRPKKFGPGGYLGKLILDLAFARTKIVQHAKDLEETEFINFVEEYKSILDESVNAQQKWNSAPVRERIAKNREYRASHNAIQERVLVFKRTVVSKTEQAELDRKVEEARARLASKGSEPELNYPAYMAFPTPIDVTDFHGTWNTNARDPNQNPFADSSAASAY